MKKNPNFKISLTALLLALTIPLVAALIISDTYSGIEQRKIMKNDEDVYYTMLYGISSDLLNADRDFYQAQLAGTQYNAYGKNVSSEIRDGFLTDYDDNAAQTLERVENAIALAKGNDYLWATLTNDEGKTMSSLHEDFLSYYDAWENAYDFKTGEGDFTTWIEDFGNARSVLSDMAEVCETWAVQEKEYNEELVEASILRSTIIFLAVSVVLLALAISVFSAF